MTDIKDRLQRTRLMIGDEALEKLSGARVAVFGIGGVGGYVAEALARAGVGALEIVDKDDVDPTNMNRQLIATSESIGRPKVDVMEERLLKVAPGIVITKRREFFLPENSDTFDFGSYDHVADCVDTVKAKVEIIAKCKEAGTPVISSMGAGNRMDPSAFEISDIKKTEMDPLARVMRKKLKEKGIEGVDVVFSREKPMKGVVEDEGSSRHAPGSISFVPPAAGLLMASKIVRDIIKD